MAKVAKAKARFLIVANNTLGSLVPCFYSNYEENNVINKIYNSIFCLLTLKFCPVIISLYSIKVLLGPVRNDRKLKQ